MFKGQRDAHVSIKVPQSCCYGVVIGVTPLVEVIVPDEDGYFDADEDGEIIGKGLAIDPSQVCFLSDKDNIIEDLNANTTLKMITHERFTPMSDKEYRKLGKEGFKNRGNTIYTNTKGMGDTEEITIDEIISRFQKYYEREL